MRKNYFLFVNIHEQFIMMRKHHLRWYEHVLERPIDIVVIRCETINFARKDRET